MQGQYGNQQPVFGGNPYTPPKPQQQPTPTWQPQPPTATPQTNGNGYNADFSGGLLSNPGYGEQWYTNNGSRLSASTNAQNYWQGIQGQFNSPYSTQPLQGAYNTYRDQMGNGPMQGTQGAYDTSWQLGHGGAMGGEQAAQRASNYFGQQGTGEQYINQNMGYFGLPTSSQNYYNNNSAFFTSPGQGEDWVAQNGGQFMQAGAAENNLANAQRNLGNINYGQQGIDLVGKGVQGAQNSQDLYRSQPFQQFVNSNPMADEYNQYFAPGLRDKSYSEKMMDSGTGGLIDPYARAQQKQSKQIDDAMAARGMFGGGAAIRAHEELDADVAASEAKDRIALAQQADQARLGRTGAAESFTQGIGNLGNQRMGMGLSAAGQADESQRANLGLGLQSFGQASQEGLSKVGLETGAATAAEQAAMDRLFKGGTMSLQAQDAAMSRLRAGGELANMSDQSGLARMNAGINAASQGQQLGMSRNMDMANAGQMEQQLAMDRMFKSGQMGTQADQMRMQQLNDMFGAANQFQNSDLNAYKANTDRMTAGFNANNQLDLNQRSGLMDQFNMATGAQNLMEGRLRGGQQDILAGAQAQFNGVAGGLDTASRERFQAQISDIEAQLQGGQISAAYAQQQINQILGSAAAYAHTGGNGQQGSHG